MNFVRPQRNLAVTRLIGRYTPDWPLRPDWEGGPPFSLRADHVGRSTFGPPFAQKKSEKGGPKKPLSGHGPEKADRVRTFSVISPGLRVWAL